jgi:cAMP phosphodiesterase
VEKKTIGGKTLRFKLLSASQNFRLYLTKLVIVCFALTHNYNMSAEASSSAISKKSKKGKKAEDAVDEVEEVVNKNKRHRKDKRMSFR